MECLKENKGMITVEMALLFPLILFSILCMCSLGLYFMDIARLNGNVQEILVYASESVGKGEDIAIGTISMKKRNTRKLFQVSYASEKKQLEEAVRTEVRNQLLYVNLKRVRIFINGTQIQATIDYEAAHNLWYWFSLREERAVVKQKVQRIRYTDQLRKRM